MAKYKKYTLEVGAKGAERLKLLNQMCNPHTLEFLNKIGDLKGKCVLDLACGVGLLTAEIARKVGSNGKVIAVDISSEQLEIAKENVAAKGLTNVEFFELPADEINKLNMKFDIVYNRFLFGHVDNPETIIEKIVSVLKKGGFYISEEGISYDSMFSFPDAEVFNRMKKMIFKNQPKIHKTDLFFGRKQYGIFKKHGFKDIDYRFIQPLLFEEEEKSQLWLGAEEIKPQMIKAKLVSEQDMDTLIKDLKEYVKNDSYYVATFKYSQISGRI
jgi:ubiquinone/menaquinone biosynthesis C-methylase UbiE